MRECVGVLCNIVCRSEGSRVLDTHRILGTTRKTLGGYAARSNASSHMAELVP